MTAIYLYPEASVFNGLPKALHEEIKKRGHVTFVAFFWFGKYLIKKRALLISLLNQYKAALVEEDQRKIEEMISATAYTVEKTITLHECDEVVSEV